MLSLTLKTIITFSLLLFLNVFALCSSDLKQAVNESEEVIATEYKTDDGIRQKIIDADKSFKKVTEAYYNGDYDLTKEEYQKFLENAFLSYLSSLANLYKFFALPNIALH